MGMAYGKLNKDVYIVACLCEVIHYYALCMLTNDNTYTFLDIRYQTKMLQTQPQIIKRR